MTTRQDVLIIGAGILGCFAARSLSRYKLDIAVLEAREDVCTGITRANTGIIYQGYDQHPGSLKAQLCRTSSMEFPALCSELDVNHRKCGLLMLSFGSNADRVLEKKLANAKAAAIPNVSIIGSDDVYKLEPHLKGGISHALYARDTYTVNPWELGIAAFENAAANGVEFHFNEEVYDIRRESGEFTVYSNGGIWRTKRLLLCGGFHSGRLWEMVSRPQVKIIPQAADYLVFDTKTGGIIDHVISIEPEIKGEGLTLVPTADGNILAGPTRRDVASEDPDYSTESEGLDELSLKLKDLIPDFPPDKVIRNFGAARPNPFYVDDNRSINDFVILEEDGLFGLIGVKTPGITCAAELGKYITNRLISTFERQPEANVSFDPARRGIIRVHKLIDKDPEAFIALPEEYHDIVCRCMNVSRGEILEAIRRGATTVDGIKRRTGAGMGRCQGGYCSEKILHILGEGADIYSITKDGTGSEILAGGQDGAL